MPQEHGARHCGNGVRLMCRGATRISTRPVTHLDPPMTTSPAAFRTGRLSPVSSDSSKSALAEVRTPSVGTWLRTSVSALDRSTVADNRQNPPSSQEAHDRSQTIIPKSTTTRRQSPPSPLGRLAEYPPAAATAQAPPPPGELATVPCVHET